MRVLFAIFLVSYDTFWTYRSSFRQTYQKLLTILFSAFIPRSKPMAQSTKWKSEIKEKREEDKNITTSKKKRRPNGSSSDTGTDSEVKSPKKSVKEQSKSKALEKRPKKDKESAKKQKMSGKRYAILN